MEEKGTQLKARSYQKELFEKAKNQNSIIFLGTGAGKTFIASLMIDHFSQTSREEGKRIIFLVNSVALVDQQTKFLRETTRLTCSSFCGKDGVDSWDDKEWKRRLKDQQILIFIHQVFLDLLNAGRFSFDCITLMIIDEIHHTRKNHPYNQIMIRYLDYKKNCCWTNLPPHVLGLSASIVNEKCDKEKFIQLKQTLEENTDCKIITTDDVGDIVKFVTCPKESFLYYSRNAVNNDPYIKDIEDIINRGCIDIKHRMNKELARRSKTLEGIELKYQKEKDKDKCDEVTRILNQLKMAVYDLGIYAVEKLVTFYDEELMETKIHVSEEQYHQEVYKIAKDLSVEVRNYVGNLYLKEAVKSELDKLERFSSKKVHTLLEKLEEVAANSTKDENMNEMLTTLIFVQMRQTAAVLCHIIDKASKLRPGLASFRPGFAIGSITQSFFRHKISQESLEKAARESQKLKETLKGFKIGKLNCIVCTSVLEEGVDVQTCNLVIRFDRIPEFRSYVQSKGRARAKPSQFIMMVDSDMADSVISEVEQYKEIELHATELIHHDGSEIPVEAEKIEVYLADSCDPINSPRVTSLSAVSLVNKYVQSLPSDRFTTLYAYYDLEMSPRFRLMQALNLDPEEEYRYLLHFPKVCPIKEPIIGSYETSKPDAKRAVALKAVEMLHKYGELDMRLRPTQTEETFDTNEEDLLESDDMRKIGTKKMRRYYEKTVPLDNLNVSSHSFVYCLSMTLMDPIIIERRKTYRPETYDRKLGIMIGTNLPSEARRPFNLFTPSGRVQVQFKFVGSISPLCEKELGLVEKFHAMVCEDVLGMVEPWMKFMKGSDSMEPLIVPIIHSKIDLSFLEDLAEGRKNHSYEDAVITERHRGITVRWFVQEVMVDMNSLSKMPNLDSTFQDYFLNNYAIQLKNLNQPLLRVSGADKKNDHFNPIVKTTKVCSERHNNIFFPPELVTIHLIPASLWRECRLLPFALNHLAKTIKIMEFRSSMIDYLSFPVDNVDNSDIPCKFDSEFDQFYSFSQLIQYPSKRSAQLCPKMEDISRCFTAIGAGLSYDLEREEMLGDSFLKYAATVYLFFTQESILSEGKLSEMRSEIVGNRNLFNIASWNIFEDLFNPTQFAPWKNWRCPRYQQEPNWLEATLMKADEKIKSVKPKFNIFQLLSKDDVMSFRSPKDVEDFAMMKVEQGDIKEMVCKNEVEPRDHMIISDKSLADSVEALIGCFLLKTGQYGALKIMSYLGLDLLNHSNMDEDWFKAPATALEVLDTADLHVQEIRMESLIKKLDVEGIEATIGYQFKNKSFLLQAFTHCSYFNNKVTNSMERLEFLGDAVIDYLVTCHIFTGNPTLSPGSLSNLRTALVNNNTFAKIIVDNNLHPQLLSSSPRLMAKIQEYVSYVKDKNVEVDTIENLKLVNEDQCPSLENADVPKVLGDLLESLMGAIYLDSELDLELVWKSFQKLFTEMEQVIEKNPQSSIKLLYEKFPNRVTFSKIDLIKGKANILVEISNVLVDGWERNAKFAGVGRTFKCAKNAAATCALRQLEKVPDF